MPGGDRTGPLGVGPRTGRGAGFCSGNSIPGFMNSRIGFRRSLGRGRNFGRGRGFWRFSNYDSYNSPRYLDPSLNLQTTKEEEKAYLEETLKGLEEEINNIKNRIQELSKK
jgi:hypothetical protein